MHHDGDSRKWYSVPAHAATDFGHAFKTALPEICSKNPDALAKQDVMLSPKVISAYKVPVFTLQQVSLLEDFCILFVPYNFNFNLIYRNDSSVKCNMNCMQTWDERLKRNCNID